MANEPALYARMELRVRDAEKKLEQFIRRADSGMAKFDRRAQQSAKRAEAAFSGMYASFGKGFLGGIAGAFSVQAAQEFLDSATRIKNALRATGVEGKAATAIYERLFVSAQKNAAPIESLVDLYSRATLVQNELGVSSEDLISFTDGVALALRASGKSATEASGALTQLSQLLGAGTVRAEEFNSVQEGALPILKAVAAGMGETGGSVARLRQLVIDGKVSSKEFFEAFQRGRGVLDGMVKGSRLTIDQGFQRLRNTLTHVAGSLDDVTGASGRVGEGLSAVSEIIKNLSDVIVGFSGKPATQFIAKLDEMVSRFEPLRRGLAILATPNLGNRLVEAMTPKRRQALDEARSEIESQFRRLPNGLAAEKISQSQFAALNRLKQQLRDNTITADGARKAIASIFGDNPGTNKLKKDLDDALAKLDELTVAAEKANDALKLDVAEFQRESNRGAAFSRIRETTDTREALSRRLLDSQRGDLEREIDARAMQIVEEFGDKISEASARLQAEREIAWEMRKSEIGGSVQDFVDQVIGAESGGDTRAKNPNSSATGLGQFISSTWIAEFKKAFPENARKMSDEAILAYRTDGAIQKQLIKQYAEGNAELLRQAGVAVNAAALHLAHFLGPQGAISVLTAAPGTPVNQVLGSDAIRANPTILGAGKTVDDVIAYGQKRAGMETSGTQRLDAREDFAKTLKEHQAYIDSLKAETAIRGELNPLVEDNGRALSTMEAAQYLLTEAQRQGTEAGKELKDVQQLLSGDLSELSPAAREQALAMRALAEETGNAEAASNQLSESQDRLKQSSYEFRSLGKDVLSGFISDLKSGESAAEALSNALGRVADKLLDMALNSFFGLDGGGGGFDFLSFLPKLFGFASGTANTGGQRGQPRGVVHGQEAVIPLPSGGRVPVELMAPNVPGRGGQGGGQSITINAPINATNSDAAGLDRLRQEVRQLGKNIPKMVVQTQKTQQLRKSRP